MKREIKHMYGRRRRECRWNCQPLSCAWLFATAWTVAHQAPLSMGFSRQEYWSGLPFPYPGDLPNPEIKPGSPALQANCLPSEPPGKSQRMKTTPLKGIMLTHSTVLPGGIVPVVWDDKWVWMRTVAGGIDCVGTWGGAFALRVREDENTED